MTTLKDIDTKIGSLKRDHKNQMDISKFLLLRAEVKIKNLRLRQVAERIEKNDQRLQKDIVEIKKILKDALQTALKARTKIQLALALLEKTKLTMKATQKRIAINKILNKSPDRIEQEHQAKERGDAMRTKIISVSCTVYEVIRKAISAYYFDKIGDSLLERTKNPDNFNLSEFKILVESYNVHVYIPVEVERLINVANNNSNKGDKKTKEH